MAKAEVVCLYCGKKFDRNTEEFVKPTARRYAHKSCYENRNEEDKIKDEIYRRCQRLYKENYNRRKIESQLEKYLANGLEIENILRSLEYFYNIKGGDKDQSQGGIGIVPYIYEEALKYYSTQKETQEKLESIKLEPQKKVFKQIKRQKISKPINLDFFDLR